MKKAISLYILLMIASSSWGQTEKLINPADLKQKTVVTEPLSLNKGFFRVGLIYSHYVVDKWFNESGKKNYMPESTWSSSSSTELWAQYGISDRLMVGLGIPYSSEVRNLHRTFMFPEWDTLIIYNPSSRGRGIGDIVASASYQIIPSKDNKFSMKASLDITIPTGRKNFKNVVSDDEYDGPTGYGVVSLTPKVSARMLVYPYSVQAYFSYNYNFSGSRMLNPTDTKETSIRDASSARLGASFNIHLNEWIALTNDISYGYWGKDKIEGVPESSLYSKWNIAYEPRIVFQIKKFRLGEAVNIPLKGKYYGADPIYVLMAQYVF
jgi:hypothetical protein